jgi:hypothetical protein
VLGGLENALTFAPWGWRAALAVALLSLVPRPAHAAEIAWHAPDACQRVEVATAQVEKLVGKRLAAVDGIAFEVEISIDEGSAHRVVLRTLATGSAPREREIVGASCSEVTDAVSVAIALTISEEARQQRERVEATASNPDSATPEAQAEPAAETVAEPASAEPRFAVGVGLLMDAGALPDLVPGLEIAGAFELKVLRIAAFAAVFVPQKTQLPNDTRGGTFDFVLAGIDLCAHPTFETLHLLACAGFEVGRIGARGEDVVNQRDGDAGWYAPRVELGVGYGFLEIARVWLRGGVAVPLARPEFVLDETDQVHQPSSTSLRGSVVVELLL